jgi:alkylation response protein AidB-like acyl-CoA dehydrogenase
LNKNYYNGSSVSTVIAQTDVEKDTKELMPFIEKRLGWMIWSERKENGILTDTHSLMFTDVKVPKENRIGADGFGFAFMNVLNGGNGTVKH